jgi:diguanylate cyclase (GGDEF)-like protein
LKFDTKPQPGMVEKLGPQARLQAELAKIESEKRDTWVVVLFAAAVLLLGAFSFFSPSSFWHNNELRIELPPQVLFFLMMLAMLVALYVLRNDAETRRLRIQNLQQALSAQSEHSASMVDSLTHVFTRAFLRDLLQGEIARAQRNHRPLGLLMCDLNRFKEVNDRFGHLTGDFVLAQVAGILKSCVRGSDFVIRYGGDEFLLVLPETEALGAEIVRQRILKKIADWDRSNRIGDIPVAISMGLHMHTPGETAEQSVAQADARMYEDKNGSRPKLANGAPART